MAQTQPAANLGAHEVMEIHEVLSSAITSINTFQLYRPHVQDPQLAAILDNQMRFAVQEYDNMVAFLSHRGAGHAVPYRPVHRNLTPMYGLRSPAPATPNASAAAINDRDVAAAVLGCHKASASLRMHAALECADSELRRLLIQGATNCAEQAYEVFQWMNQKGYYQVPTLQVNTTQTLTALYQPAPPGLHTGVQ